MTRRWRQLFFFLVLLSFWLLLSGRLDPLLVGLGVAFSLLIVVAATPMFEHTIRPAGAHPRVRAWRLVVYIGWLLGRMLVSALQVAWIVLNPRVPPQPGIVRLRTELRSPAARAMLSNSITLVPGTLTLEMSDQELTVHTFTPDAVEDLATAAMQTRIALIFGDVPQQPPQLHWEEGYSLAERGRASGEADT